MSCQQGNHSKKGTIKVSILYAQADGKSFDMDYYSNKHMPMVAELFGDALVQYEIDKGITGRTTDEPLPYIAIGTFYFDTLEEYERVFRLNAEQILGDIPNYTDIQPLVQISEVIK
jgi:uncharacterized protein (TIGR02118 family)